MNIRRIIRKLRSSADLFSTRARASYSQFAEDLLVDHVLTAIAKKNNPTYLDIGTNDPVAGNNTYLFYLKGCKGVCVEPDPAIYRKIKAKRPNDTVLHAGVGIGTDKEGTLYIFPEGYTGWNTFSKEEADKRKSESGISYSTFKHIPFIPVNEVIRQHFKEAPDFISIDVEGLDQAILETLDFGTWSPLVICVETMSFSTDHQGGKIGGIISLLHDKGYVIYADTYVNTIFVRKDLLKSS